MAKFVTFDRRPNDPSGNPGIAFDADRVVKVESGGAASYSGDDALYTLTTITFFNGIELEKFNVYATVDYVTKELNRALWEEDDG